MTRRPTRPVQLLAVGIAALLGLATAQAAVSLTATELSYGQDFDSLANINGSDPAWSNNTTLPGWSLFAGPNLDATVSNVRVSTSSGSDRAHISYGLNGVSERALGMQAGSSHRYAAVAPGVGEAFGTVAVAFSNDSGNLFTAFSFSYTGEQWHVSSNAGVPHSLLVNWALGPAGTAFNQLNWQGFSAEQANPAGVDFFTPTLSGGVSGNGNLPANRVADLGAAVTGLQWAPGDQLWLRWTDLNDPASDHGMAIDNFTFLATPVPAPASVWMLLAGLTALGAWRRRKA